MNENENTNVNGSYEAAVEDQNPKTDLPAQTAESTGISNGARAGVIIFFITAIAAIVKCIVDFVKWIIGKVKKDGESGEEKPKKEKKIKKVKKAEEPEQEEDFVVLEDNETEEESK